MQITDDSAKFQSHMLITCLLKIVAFRADHQVKCKCWWLLHTQNCVKLHHTQIHHGGNDMKCDFPTRDSQCSQEISTSFFYSVTMHLLHETSTLRIVTPNKVNSLT